MQDTVPQDMEVVRSKPGEARLHMQCLSGAQAAAAAAADILLDCPLDTSVPYDAHLVECLPAVHQNLPFGGKTLTAEGCTDPGCGTLMLEASSTKQAETAGDAMCVRTGLKRERERERDYKASKGVVVSTKQTQQSRAGAIT